MSGPPTRVLITNATLPRRNTPGERVATLDADIREAAAKMRATLIDKSHEFTVTGWELDDESWEMAANGTSILLSVKLRRPA